MIFNDGRRRIEQAIDWASVHQVGAHETGEGEQALDGGLCGIGEAEEEKGDEGDRDLNAHGVFRGAALIRSCGNWASRS